ncbi:MAG: diguanylate cyclase [Steroidobacteraceae bacterium]
MAEPDQWRRKYLDALGRLEDEETRWKSLEGLLRRLVNRLCVAAQGVDPRLDTEIQRLTEAMRRKAGEEQLEPLFEPLSSAIAAIDSAKQSAPRVAHSASAKVHTLPAAKAAPASSSLAAATATVNATLASLGFHCGATPAPPAPQDLPSEAFFGDERIRATITGMLADLRRMPNLRSDVEALDHALEVSLTAEQLPDVLERISELVSRRISSLKEEKRDVEELLRLITGRLDEFTAYISSEDSDRRLALESTNELKIRVLGEMTDLSAVVDRSVNVEEVQSQVHARLSSIQAHLTEFREREETRASSHWERSERMRHRVEKLEAEAHDLRDRLRDEQRLAMVDSLTQLPNRLAYDQRLGEEFARWKRFGHPVCISAWDIDHFKKINDAYGHKAGDKVLRVVADCFGERVRNTDFVARYGGEEFVMILTGADPGEVMRLADEVRAAIQTLGFHFRGAPVAVTVSCGLTMLHDSDTAEDAFERADKALYQAKEAGRNRIVLA